MQKISESTNTANPAGEFTEGNPAAGAPATLLKAPWLNAIQRELVGLVLGAGISLNANDDGQVLKAVKALAGAAADFDKLSNKPTTLSGYGITDGITAAQMNAALQGKASKATTLGGYGITDAFTKPEANSAIQQAVAALVASSPAALDTLKELATALGNDPNFAATVTNALAGKMPISGGPYSPSFLSARVVDSSDISNPGSHISYGTDGALTNCFNSVCNKATGTGGFTWRTVNAANSVTGPTMSYTAEGVLTVPTGLWVPALTANTTVLTQAEGYTGQYAASCAFVATAVGRKVSSDRLVTAGFYGGAKTAPYFVHNDGSVVYLQVDRPKDTALLTANGWSKNADTGEIVQRAEVAIGDSLGSMLVSVTWPFQFPTKCLRADFSLRVANGSRIAIIAGFYDITPTGATVKFEELNSAVQSGLVLMVEAVGY